MNPVAKGILKVLAVLVFVLPLVLLWIFGRPLPEVKRLTAAHIAPYDTDEETLAKIDALIQKHSKWASVRLEGKDGFIDKPVLRFEQDIDGDGLADIIESYDSPLDIHASSGKKVYDPGLAEFPSRVTSLGFDDVDGDGVVDAWCCDPGDDNVSILWGDETGCFSTRQMVSLDGIYAQGGFFDVDGNGNLDYVLREVSYDERCGMTTSPQPRSPSDYYWIRLEKR
jgi:hypothetical protein